jgi:peroxiredoxin
MSTKNARKNARRSPSRGSAARGRPAAKRRSTGLWVVGGIALALVALGLIFVTGRSSSTPGGSYRFDVGNPGPGAEAPPIDLPSTAGGTFDLKSTRGTTLLYFQEGLTCQPCWDQLVDIQQHMDRFQALGIDQVVSITTDPIGQIEQKVSDEGITEPVLSDPDLSVSSAYSANSFGMMGNSRDGHTFIVIGPDGKIRWRADYGGAPDYTMYVPVDALVADISRGLGDAY